jgi:putative ABC transport system permease protein
VLTGLIIGQLGLVLCTPALVGLVARLGRFLPLAPRIALRDTARNRAAAAPAISAVMAAVTGALALGIYLTAAEQRSDATHLAGLPVGHAAVPYEVWGDGRPHVLTAGERERVLDALESTLPVDRVHQIDRPACLPADDAEHCWLEVPVAEPHRCPAEALRTERVQALFESGATAVSDDSLLTAEEQRAARADPRCQEPRQGWSVHLGNALVDDGAAIPALMGGDQTDLAGARQTLARGGVVVTDARKVVDGQAALEVSRHDGEEEQTREITVEAYVLDSGENVPFAVLSPRLLDRLGLAGEPYGLVAATTQTPTQAQEEALRAALNEIHPNLGRQVQVERGGFGSEDPFLLVLAAVAAVVALAAAGIATGLAAADRRGDLATLGAVGATPRVRRLLSISQSGVIAGLGAGLGAIAGLGSATAVLVALNRAEAHVWPVAAPPYQLAMPWPALVLLLVAAPAVAMLGAGLLTRSRLPIERRRT